jgi:hypothetical protein
MKDWSPSVESRSRAAPSLTCSFRPPPGARYQPPLTRVADRPLTRLLPDCAGQERAFPLFDRSIASFARSERCFGRLRRRLTPGGSPSDPGGILAPAISPDCRGRLARYFFCAFTAALGSGVCGRRNVDAVAAAFLSAFGFFSSRPLAPRPLATVDLLLIDAPRFRGRASRRCW